MKKLYVYADFDWLKEIELVGELGYESLRGSDSYSFKFADSWIKKYNAITLSEDLNNYPGIQYTQPEKDIFGCFADALPERWGALFSFVVSRYWHKRRADQFADYHRLTF